MDGLRADYALVVRGGMDAAAVTRMGGVWDLQDWERGSEARLWASGVGV